MNKLFWKRAGITAVSVIGGAYAVFLVSPLILNPRAAAIIQNGIT